MIEVKIDCNQFTSGSVNAIFELLKKENLGFIYSFETIVLSFETELEAYKWIATFPTALYHLGIRTMPTNFIKL